MAYEPVEQTARKSVRRETYNEGDRVIIVVDHAAYNNSIIAGMTGTVIHTRSSDVGIRFDENIGGSGHTIGGRCQGNGYYLALHSREFEYLLEESEVAS